MPTRRPSTPPPGSILLLMFELETYLLDDKHFTRRVTFLLHALRAVCYCFIVYAFTGYLTRLLFINSSRTACRDGQPVCNSTEPAMELPAGFGQAGCPHGRQLRSSYRDQGGDLPDRHREFADRRGTTCGRPFAWPGPTSSIPGAGSPSSRCSRWTFGCRTKTGSAAPCCRVSTGLKLVLYSTLFAAAVYWGIKGTFVEFWDAFLWLVAFFFIERNVVEWRQEDNAA